MGLGNARGCLDLDERSGKDWCWKRCRGRWDGAGREPCAGHLQLREHVGCVHRPQSWELEDLVWIPTLPCCWTFLDLSFLICKMEIKPYKIGLRINSIDLELPRVINVPEYMRAKEMTWLGKKKCQGKIGKKKMYITYSQISMYILRVMCIVAGCWAGDREYRMYVYKYESWVNMEIFKTSRFQSIVNEWVPLIQKNSSAWKFGIGFL